MSMTPDAIVRQWFQQVWDEGREDAIDRLADPHAVIHGLGAAPMRGTADFKKMFHVFREALGDLEIAVEHTVTQGDTCAAHCRVKGRHVGHALGGDPTGHPVEFTGIHHRDCARRPHRRRMELLRLSDDVSTDRLGGDSAGAVINRRFARARPGGLQLLSSHPSLA